MLDTANPSRIRKSRQSFDGSTSQTTAAIDEKKMREVRRLQTVQGYKI
jgi:16S rRNA U516 pseudouridylate synthase RsuA-like enzyme